MSSTKTILVAEDEEIISDTLVEQLKEEGYDPVLVKDGKEAWDKIQSIKPLLIVLDLIMPYINGFDLLRKIKGDKKIARIPVIVLSNLGQASDIEECKKLGVEDYLVKSNVTIDNIVAVIKKFVK